MASEAVAVIKPLVFIKDGEHIRFYGIIAAFSVDPSVKDIFGRTRFPRFFEVASVMTQTSLDKDKIRFLLLEGVHQSAVDIIKAAGYTNIEYHTKSLPEAELKAKIADAHFIGIRSRTHLTREILQEAKKLTAIGCFCIGTNQVDLGAALEQGIAVFNAPYSNTRSVAELVLAEAILLLRGIPKERGVSSRRLDQVSGNSFEIRGKKLGIIGYGSIGTQLSILAEGLGMKVYFYDIVAKLPLGNATQVDSLNELLGMCDIVSLHVPETLATKDMMGASEIAAMKQNSILINAARGTVVDIDALAAAIKSKNSSEQPSTYSRLNPW